MSSDDETSFVLDSEQEDEEEPQAEEDQQLWYALEHRDVEKVQLALQNGADVDCISENSDSTPLTMACQHGLDKIVRILLDAGADARWQDSIYYHGRSALHAACSGGHLTTVAILLNHDKDLLQTIDDEGQTPLFAAILGGHVDVVRFMLDRGANIYATDQHGVTALMVACIYPGLTEMVRLVIAAGVDVEARDRHRQTALHHAEIEAARELILHQNADLLAVDRYGETPFDLASKMELRTPVADLLLAFYRDKLTQCHGRLALHVLFKVAEYSFAELQNFHPPWNPLQINLPLGKLNLKHLRTLLQYFGTDFLRNRDGAGKLPIHVACQTKAPVEVLSMLVDLDSATLQIADHSGNLPLHECCNIASDYSSMRYLVEQGGVGTLAARNFQGLLPLHTLCGSRYSSLQTVQYLMQCFPGSIMAKTNSGQYPFMVAASTAVSLSVVYELVRANPGLLLPTRV